MFIEVLISRFHEGHVSRCHVKSQTQQSTLSSEYESEHDQNRLRTAESTCDNLLPTIPFA
jgi:hypothetical protein